MSVYEVCPIFIKDNIILRKTEIDDLEDLLKCYADTNSVRFFNSDNCHGDDFHYDSIEKMKKAIEFWNYSYDMKYFVRWSVIIEEKNETVGTIEMLRRESKDEFYHFGLLRIDLRSDYEKMSIISSILEIANEKFYDLFDTKSILTKSFSLSIERSNALIHSGYSPLGKRIFNYTDYLIRHK